MGLAPAEVKSTRIDENDVVIRPKGRVKIGDFRSFGGRFVASRRAGWYRRV